jgi:hypothetical protein
MPTFLSNDQLKLKGYQIEAIRKLRTGSILQGGVGSGKSITSLAYYISKECGGDSAILGGTFKEMTQPKDLVIITTARKRDTLEWNKECANFGLSIVRESSLSGILVIIDSWNNIKKYEDLQGVFFIFDEQRVVGSGAWVKSFLKIVKQNNWILLSATPGDTWLDYVPVFIGNGFYKNRTAFIARHVIYSPYVSFPKVQRYLETEFLERCRTAITVRMNYKRETETIHIELPVKYNKSKTEELMKNRWNFYKNGPVKNAAELCYLLRRVTNEDTSRSEALSKNVLPKHKKLIVFYNFNYELDLLRILSEEIGVVFKEWNGSKHEEVPSNFESWIYAVQYNSGAEAWNCIETDTILFWSQNYSYRMMTQAAGRIDRMNTPFDTLYYYYFISTSPIDLAILNARKEKKNFNENTFVASQRKHML